MASWRVTVDRTQIVTEFWSVEAPTEEAARQRWQEEGCFEDDRLDEATTTRLDIIAIDELDEGAGEPIDIDPRLRMPEGL